MSTDNAQLWKGTALRILTVLFVLFIVVGTLGAYNMWMPGESYHGALPALSDVQGELKERLRGHVEMLAGEIGPRYAGRPQAMERAADYIADQFDGLGYKADRQEFQAVGQTFQNIEAELEGGARASEIVVVGAHYDTAGATPGADDNASGVAGMLELARLMADARPERTVRFVAFANEEAPYFHTDSMGSRVYARRARQAGEDIVAMFSLEMLGYYSEEPGSQEYPAFLGMFYPDRGDFIAFVSNVESRAVVTRSIEVFRQKAAFPSEGLSAPTMVPGVSLSDQWAFWQEDYPAMMVTDTAFFRNPHYHQLSDTPETLDFARFARVVDGLRSVFEHWAG